MTNDDTSVRVAVRIRPQGASEVIDMCRVCTRVTTGEPQVTLGTDKSFTYDHVFDMNSTQLDIYETCVHELVDGALSGYNATVLAYGQTGSGKTYTMGTGFEVDPQDEQVGIIPRAIQQLFHGIETCSIECKEQEQLPPEVTVHAQFMELYNEEIVDLFDSGRDHFGNRANLRVTEDGAGGVRVTGAVCRPIRCASDAIAALRSGALARSTAATNMNATSSRSHAVFTLHVTQRRLVREQMEDGAPDPTNEFETLTAKFHFVDLAGSERLKRTGATGERQREGISINCGLLALGNVISALGDKSRKATHIPYRDSKLTRLLQDSLGGNSRTLMIACVSPSDRDFMETLNTLKYANRARNIKNKVVLNQDKSSRTIALLRQEVAQLQLELLEYRQGKRIISDDGTEGINDLYHENTILQSEVETLRTRIKGMQATIDGLLAKNSELIAEKTLGAWTTGGIPNAEACDLTALVRGYVEEIEELRAKLFEAESSREAERRRPTRFISSINDSPRRDPDTVISTAKRELEIEKELLERSMSESLSLGERERAEGESGGDSEGDSDDDHEDRLKARVSELASLSGDIDTKQRLIEELELSQKRLQSMKKHYEEKLLALQHRIKLTQEERDRVLASLAAGRGSTNSASGGATSDEAKRIREQYERKLADMGRELRRLNQARAEHARLARSSSDAHAKLELAKRQLHDMKRHKVKLLNQMKEESVRHKREQNERAKEIARLKRETVKNAHVIRGLEAEGRAREGVLKRKREELAAVRRNARARPGGEASHKRVRAVERALEEAALRRATVAEIEADMERQLEERGRLTRELRAETEPEAREALEAAAKFASEAVAEAQQQLCAAEAENNDEALRTALAELRPVDALEAASAIATAALRHAAQAALARARRHRAERRLREIESDKQTALEVETKLQPSPTQSQYNGIVESPVNGNISGAIMNGSVNVSIGDPASLNESSSVIRAATDAALAKFAHISSGTSTRSVSPVDSTLLELRNDAKNLALNIDNAYSPERMRFNELTNSPSDKTFDRSPVDGGEGRFVRYTQARGSVRLRDLGVLPREDALSRSLHEPSRGNYPLTRVPSAPGDLKTLSSPRTPRRSLQSPLLTRPAVASSPPGSPQVMRRSMNADADVFCRLTAAQDAERLAGGSVREYDGKPNPRSSLQCTHVAEGHFGAVLSLAAHDNTVLSGGVDRTVRVWDMSVGRESRCLAGHSGGVVAVKRSGPALAAVAGQHVRIWDLRTGQPIKTLWSSGATGGPGPARGGSLGEVTINDACLSLDGMTLYTAVSDKLRVWDLRKYETLGRLSTGHQAPVMCLAVRDGINKLDDIIITGSKDHYVRIMEGKMTRRLLQPPHYDGVQSVCVHGSYVYSGSRDASIKRWKVFGSQDASHSVTAAHKGWVTSLTWWDQLGMLVSTGREGVVRLWDGELRPAARAQSADDSLHAAAVTGTQLYTAGSGGEVKAWRRTAT